MERQLVHIVESSARHHWFEELVFVIKGKKIQQSVITLEPRGDIFAFLENESIYITGGKQTFRVLKLFRAALSVKKIGLKPESLLVFAHGHLASVSALISKLLFQIDYGIVHHQSPIIFFDSYQRRHPIKGTIHRYLYMQYIRRAKFIQALSLEVFNSLVKLGYLESQIILLGHGIAMNNFTGSSNLDTLERTGNSHKGTILMVGRLSWEKNYFLAFKVIAELVKKCPELNVIIAGTGPDFDRLIEVKNELNLEANIKMVGWQPNISKLMLEADLFLHLSLTESYGQVLLEACLCNLPIFTFPVGIALDLKEANNPLIHILNNQSPEVISEEILTFLTDSENRLAAKVSPALEVHSNGYIHSAMAAYLTDQCSN